MIEFHCARCGKKLRVRDDTGGKRGKCPQCGAVLDVPQLDQVIPLAETPVISQAPPAPASPLPARQPPVQGSQPGAAVFPSSDSTSIRDLFYNRGPVGGPMIPYRPETFSTLYLWFAILYGAGILLAVILIGIPAWIAAIVLCNILLFKAWNQIQDGYQRTSAGKAVGFCFIPFFNFYWIFVAFYGLAQDLNAYARRYQIPAPPVSEGLALTYCILVVCSIIPYLGLLTALAALVISFIFLHQIKAASMAVAHAKLQAASAAIA